MSVDFRLSVVDQSPIFTNTNADQAIKDSVELAQYSDQIWLFSILMKTLVFLLIFNDFNISLLFLFDIF